VGSADDQEPAADLVSETSEPRGAAAAATTGRSVARSGVWNLAGAAIPQLYLALVSVAAARFLGAAEFGRQSFIAFVELTAIMLFTAGLPTALARFVGLLLGRDQPRAVRALVTFSGRLLAPLAIGAGAGLAAAGLLGADPSAAWGLAGVGALFGILRQAPQAVLNGAQRWRDASISGLVVGAGATALTVAVLAAGAGITGMFAVEAAAEGIALLWLLVLARRFLRRLPPAGEAVVPIRELLSYVAYVSVGVVLTFVVWRRSELFFLAHYSTDTQIAYYSVAFAAVAVVLMLPGAIAGVLLPAVATLHGAGDIERIRSGYGRALRAIVLLSLPLAAGSLAVGPELIRLVYGSSFEAAGAPLRVLLAPLPVISAVGLASVLLAGIGRLRPTTVMGVFAAAVNIALNFLLIPRLDALGAALASSIAQVVIAVPMLVYAHTSLGGVRWEPLSLVKTALASAIGGFATWGVVELVGGLVGVVAGLVGGLAIFFALAWALRILSADDAEWFDRHAGGFLGGRVGRVIRLWGVRPKVAHA
jgi:O-antigen/teichoic acid export membrane protein